MAYSAETKREAKRLYYVGLSPDEVAAKLKINPDTVYRWKRQEDWDKPESNDAAEALDKRISAIAASDDELTDAQLRKLEKLTVSRDRLRKAAPKPQKGKAKGAKNVPDLDIKVIGNIREQAMDMLYSYQMKFLQDDARFRVCLKSRQIGFSFLLGLEVMLGAIERRENQIVVSASQDQSDIVRNYSIKWCNDLSVDYLEDGGNLIFPGGAIGYFLPCNPRTVQGYTGDVYLDEYAWHMRQRLMWQAVVPAITVGKKRLTVTSTPYTEYDMFGEIVTQPDKYPRFSRHSVSIYDAIADGHQVDIEELRDLFDAYTFAQAYECKFFLDEMALLSPEEVKVAFDDTCIRYVDRPVRGGVDIGRYRDLTAIALAEQLPGELPKEKITWIRHMKTLEKMPFETQKTHLSGLFEEWKMHRLAIDATGIGMNLAEDMQRLFPSRIERVVFTKEKKESLALGLKKLFEQKRIRIPNDRDLVAQLHAIKRKAGTTGFSYDSERNEQIKHADLFWALALAVKDFAGGRRVLTRDNVKVMR